MTLQLSLGERDLDSTTEACSGTTAGRRWACLPAAARPRPGTLINGEFNGASFRLAGGECKEALDELLRMQRIDRMRTGDPFPVLAKSTQTTDHALIFANSKIASITAPCLAIFSLPRRQNTTYS